FSWIKRKAARCKLAIIQECCQAPARCAGYASSQGIAVLVYRAGTVVAHRSLALVDVAVGTQQVAVAEEGYTLDSARCRPCLAEHLDHRVRGSVATGVERHIVLGPAMVGELASCLNAASGRSLMARQRPLHNYGNIARKEPEKCRTENKYEMPYSSKSPDCQR